MFKPISRHFVDTSSDLGANEPIMAYVPASSRGGVRFEQCEERHPAPQVARGGGEDGLHGKSHKLGDAGLAQPADGRHPAERFLQQLTSSLTDLASPLVPLGDAVIARPRTSSTGLCFGI